LLANLSPPQKKQTNSLSATRSSIRKKKARGAPSEEGVEREARHEHAVHKLDHTRQDEEDEEGVDEFQT
jgi:hypothetical protein